MTDNYNSVFKPASSPTEISSDSESKTGNSTSIYDISFSQTNMLTGPYTVRNYSTLCLFGPADGDKYEWTVRAVKGNGYKEGSLPVTVGKTQRLSLYVPESALSIWTEYELTLTVYVDDGRKYTDTATLWVVPA